MHLDERVEPALACLELHGVRPQSDGFHVTGPIEGHLWVATSAVDTDFTAKLIDVYPPSAWYPQGYALNLTDSIARLRYSNNREQGEPVKAGEPVEATITLYPTSNQFMSRHRITLDVSKRDLDSPPPTASPFRSVRGLPLVPVAFGGLGASVGCS